VSLAARAHFDAFPTWQTSAEKIRQFLQELSEE
jgi:hypothetical protein